MNGSSWIERSEFGQSVRIDNRARILALAVRPGSGIECSYCHKPIGAEAIEYEVEAMVMAAPRVLHFHRVCQHLWEVAVA